ncbi:hypothetical protein PJL18_01819 [Paenarthrobacter nicotinovorans]|nr:hypothetical protein [Paenarthrobacter nicotinovorans]
MLIGRRFLGLQGEAGIAVAAEQSHALGCPVLGGFAGHAACQVHEDQLVVVDVQRRGCGEGGLGGEGGVEQFALRADGDVFAGTHGQCASQEPCNAAHEDHGTRYTRRGHAHDQRQVAHQTVVGAENCSTEGTREPVASTGRQAPDYFLVDLFIGHHRGGGGRLGSVGGAALCTLRQGQDEDRTEVAGQEPQELAAGGSCLGHACVLTQEFEPVRFMTPFGFGQSQQDLPFLAVAALGEFAVDRSLGAFIGKVLPPTPDVRRSGCCRFCGVVEGCGFDCGVRSGARRTVGFLVHLHFISCAGWGSCGPIARPTLPLICRVFWLVFLSWNVRCTVISGSA